MAQVVYVARDSHEFNEQIRLFTFLKTFDPETRGLCKFSSKLCITCWQIITAADYAQHPHQFTGEFHKMDSATAESLIGLCKNYKKVQTGVPEKYQLFKLSETL